MSSCFDFNSQENQHLRYNPLKGEWVLVSPHRMLRPWDGKREEPTQVSIKENNPSNPLCPGGTRANGVVTPMYTSTFIFTNDFPALKPDGPTPSEEFHPLFQTASAKGTCRVMCFHPKSNVTIPTMSEKDILHVINGWISQLIELGSQFEWVQIFENKGEIMGCSNPHPHCQIWASSFIPNEPRVKDEQQLIYYQKYGRPLLMDYVQQELDKQERIVVKNSHWVALVPFWAVWPFETLVLPTTHVMRFYDLDQEQRLALAHIMKVLTIKYDNLFNTSFPYSMGWHGAPTGKFSEDKMDHWVFHGIYLPPLLRSASVKKFMVGYEMLAQNQRDLTPEKAAFQLRDQSSVHYTEVPPAPVIKVKSKVRKESSAIKGQSSRFSHNKGAVSRKTGKGRKAS